MAQPVKEQQAPAGRRLSNRREEILRVAAEIFATKGFATATVRDVADAAGIQSGSLYHHFKTKDQIVEEIVRPVLERNLAAYRAINGPADQVLVKMIDVAFEYALEHRHASLILQNEIAYLRSLGRFDGIVDLQDQTRATWVEVLAHGVEEGVFDPDLDIEAAYLVIMGAVATTVRWVQFEELQLDGVLGDRMASVLLGGLLNGRAKRRANRRVACSVTS